MTNNMNVNVSHPNIMSSMTSKKSLTEKSIKDSDSVLLQKSKPGDFEFISKLKNLKMTASAHPSIEQLREITKNAAMAIWDLLKKEKKDDKKDATTSKLLALMMKLHSNYTFEHSQRVMDLAMAFAQEMGGKDQTEMENLRSAAYFKDIGLTGPDNLSFFPGQYDEEVSKNIINIKNTLLECSNLHDIGKMKIPDSILNKNSPLTFDEYNLIKQHPLIGEQILMQFPHLYGAIPGVRGHHERWDGKGYPDAKKGDEIPIQARIISICDTFDAMTEDRPYRKALSHDEALKELISCSGTQFDPKLVYKFIYALDRKGEIMINLYQNEILELKQKFDIRD